MKKLLGGAIIAALIGLLVWLLTATGSTFLAAVLIVAGAITCASIFCFGVIPLLFWCFDGTGR